MQAKNIRKSYKNNKFEMLARKWNDKFKLASESYFYEIFNTIFSILLKSVNQ